MLPLTPPQSQVHPPGAARPRSGSRRGCPHAWDGWFSTCRRGRTGLPLPLPIPAPPGPARRHYTAGGDAPAAATAVWGSAGAAIRWG
eukprot:scaffold30203_cov51-Isochrysis_galbana.AAC.1